VREPRHAKSEGQVREERHVRTAFVATASLATDFVRAVLAQWIVPFGPFWLRTVTE
jgi:hypothetical protein